MINISWIFCPKLKLIIEIDFEVHKYQGENDEKRQNRLETLGFHFLRFTDLDVKKKMKDILASIEDWIEECEKLTHLSAKAVSPLDRGE